MDVLEAFERYVAGLDLTNLDQSDKATINSFVEKELRALWLPEPENKPQVEAYCSHADLLLFGGAAGGGKTDILIGLALTEHYRSVIFRSQAKDLRAIEERIIELAGRDGWNGTDKILRRKNMVIELGHLEKPGSERGWQGRPHDLICFDEGAQLSRQKVQFVLGWLRSSNPKQRRRAVIATNPPTGGEGDWLVEWFAPWLDERFANPAKTGELRWAASARDKEATTIWIPDGRPIFFTGESDYRIATEAEIKDVDADDRVVVPLTRTFIPSLLKNNPYLAQSGYRAQLQALPEPLRSQLLNGDFVAGRQDHEWQVIPTAWVKAAQERWTPRPPEHAQMSAIGVDVAQGGADQTVLAPRHGPWYAPLIVRPGVTTPNPSDVAGLVVSIRRDLAAVVLDVGGGYGGGVKERLAENGIEARPFNGSGESSARTKDKQLSFLNKRSEAVWRLREALDPDQEHGSPIAIPQDPHVLADLTAYRWKLAARGIQIESKEELK